MATTASHRPTPRRYEAPAVGAAGRDGWAVAAWAVLVTVGVVWGHSVAERHPEIHVGAAPLAGRWDLALSARVLPALAVGFAVVVAGPQLSRILPWRRLLVAAAAAAAAWAVTLAVIDGAGALAAPLASRYDYLPAVPLVDSPGQWLEQGFLERTTYDSRLTPHVQSHPPGMVLLLWALDRAGLGGPGPAAVIVVAAGATAVAAVLLCVRELCDETAARRAAPFMVVAPFAIWVATAADALFLGLGAWGVTLAVLATGRSGARAGVLAFSGGAVLTLTAYFTYGAALLWLVPVAVVWHRRRPGLLVWAAAGAASVAVPVTLAGFWWVEGLDRARLKYRHGIAAVRPYSYFVVGNLAAAAMAVGPAAAAGLARLRRAGPWLLPAGAGAAILVADVSGLTKGEVERIWLPFLPWLVAGVSALPAARQKQWLTVQAASGLGLQLALRSPW